MLNASNLIQLPYTSDLSEGGCAYACRWLAGTYGHLGDSPAGQLRRCASGAAVELAFRRYLSRQAVPFEVRVGAPFSQPGYYALELGGHRCDLISYLVSRPNQVAQLSRDPASLLQAPALVPLDQFAADGHKPGDLFVFAFLAGRVAASVEDVKSASAASQTIHLIHPLPDPWRRPAGWQPLEQLALKSECAMNVPVEIGGLDGEREFSVAVCELPPRTRVKVPKEFYSLAYIHPGSLPTARLGVHSPVCGDPYILQPHEWSDIWIRGEQILLAGWLTHEEFRSKAQVLNAGMPTFQFAHTHTRNLQVPLSELNPLGGLLGKVREWEAGK